jgi:hypothetical protein
LLSLLLSGLCRLCLRGSQLPIQLVQRLSQLHGLGLLFRSQCRSLALGRSLQTTRLLTRLSCRRLFA